MFEAYKVGVTVTLINHVTTEMRGIIRHLGEGGDAAKKLQSELHKIRLLSLASAGTAAVGFMGLGMIHKTIKPASEYAHQLQLMNISGMKHLDIVKAMDAAWATSSKVITTTAAENMEAIRELRSAFGAGQESHVFGILDTVQRSKGILTALSGKEQDHFGFDMVKAIEQRTPLMTEEALRNNADRMTKALIGFGGTLTVQDFHAAFKYGKMATMKWSDDFAYNYFPTFMQEMKTGKGGAQIAGTAMMSLYQQQHGRLLKAAVPFWVQSGLLDQNDIVRNATGAYQAKPGSVKGTALFEENPYAWVQKFLVPAIGTLATKNHVTEETAINSLFSNKNAAFAAYTMYKKATQFERDAKLIGQVDSKTAYDKLVQNDPMMAKMALAKQWENLLATLGFEIMPQLIGAMRAGINVTKNLTGWFREHEDITKGLVLGFALLAGAMAIGGTLTTLYFGFLALSAIIPVLGGAGVTGIGSLIAILSGPVGLSVAAGVAIIGLGALVKWLFDKGKKDNANPTSGTEATGGYHGWDFGSAAAKGSGPLIEYTGHKYWEFKKSDRPIQVNTQVNLDGAKLARVVTTHQANEAERPQYLSGNYDFMLAAPAVGY